MLLFKNRQNGRELRTNPWTFSHKGNFFFYSHWYSAASTEKKTSVEVRCVCSLHVWVSTWMRLAAGFLLFSKCFCRCCSCTFRAKPEPRMPYVEKTKTHTEFTIEKKSTCSYLCNMYRLFWRNTESVISHCATMFYSQLAGQRRRSPAEQNTLIITAPSTSVGSCHRSQ